MKYGKKYRSWASHEELYQRLLKDKRGLTYAHGTAEQLRLYRRRRRLREMGVKGGHYTEQEWLDLLELHAGRCAACGTDAEITRDHIVALSRGGTDDIENIQPLCMACNRSKNNRDDADFKRSRPQTPARSQISGPSAGTLAECADAMGRHANEPLPQTTPVVTSP